MQPQNSHDDRETIRALEVLSASAEPPPLLHGVNPAATRATGDPPRAHPSAHPDQPQPSRPQSSAHPPRAADADSPRASRALAAPTPGSDTRHLPDGRVGPSAGGTPDSLAAPAAAAPGADSGATDRGTSAQNAADGGSPRAVADARALAALAVTYTRPPARSPVPPVGPVRPAPAKPASGFSPVGGSRAGPPPIGAQPARPPASHERASPPAAPARTNAATGAPPAADRSGPVNRPPPPPAESHRAAPPTVLTESQRAAPPTLPAGSRGSAPVTTRGETARSAPASPAEPNRSAPMPEGASRSAPMSEGVTRTAPTSEGASRPAPSSEGSNRPAPTSEGSNRAAPPPTAGLAAGATVALPATKDAPAGGVAPPGSGDAPPALPPRGRGRPPATASSEVRGAPYRCLRCGYPLLPESGWRCSECGAAHQESVLRHWYSADERLRASRLQWICGAVLFAHVCTLPSAIGLLQAGIFDLLRIAALVLAGWGAWEAGRRRFSTPAGTWAIGGMLCPAVTAWWALASGRGGWDVQMGVALGEMAAAWLLLGAFASPADGVAHWGSVRGRRIALIGLCLSPLVFVAISIAGALLASSASAARAALALSGQAAGWGGGTTLGPAALLLIAGLPTVLQLAARGFVWLWITAQGRALYGTRGR